MSTATLIERKPAAPNDDFDLSRLHRFTVEQYHEMIDSGVIKPEHRVELLEGIVVEKMGQKPPHSSTLRKLLRMLAAVLPEQYILSPQSPITLATSEPEPDIAVLFGPEERYDDRHPVPADIGSIIEIADTSLTADRRQKAIIYAANKIREYWIVNLPDRVVEVYANPRNGRQTRYKPAQIYKPNQLVPLILHGKKIADLNFRDILR